MKKFLLVFSIIFSAVLITGCINQDQGSSLSESEATNKKLNTSAEKQDALKKFATMYSDDQGLNMVMKGQITASEEGQEFTLDIDSQVDGENVKMTLGAGSEKMIWIIVDNITYISTDESTWYKLPEEATEDSTFIDPDEFSTYKDSLNEDSIEGEDYEYLGVAKCGNNWCHKFKMTDETAEGTIVFIDVENSKLRRIEIQSNDTNGYFDIEDGTTAISAPSNFETLEGFEAFGKMFELMMPLFEEAGMDFEGLE